MKMAEFNTIRQYLYDNKSLVLATVDPAGDPQLRHIGAYNIVGKDIVFLTSADTEKTKQIAANNSVALLFQHEGQQSPKNITIYGHAKVLDPAAAEAASELIRQRRPQIKYDPDVNVIYKVETDTVKVLDFSAEVKQKVYTAAQLA